MLLTQGCIAVSCETVGTKTDGIAGRLRQTQSDRQADSDRRIKRERERDRHGGRSIDTYEVKF